MPQVAVSDLNRRHVIMVCDIVRRLQVFSLERYTGRKALVRTALPTEVRNFDHGFVPGTDSDFCFWWHFGGTV